MYQENRNKTWILFFFVLKINRNKHILQDDHFISSLIRNNMYCYHKEVVQKLHTQHMHVCFGSARRKC